ncbi:hypothetical protein AAG747_02830 [Rapidithrix thailandica]|uniref:MotA/TolQ/ExbB proton channel domain-containing protein n=1 Tax=Rapidithrix thailandica TaxID=413964 RepID=A0AAW9RT87_9BACT
MDFQLIDPIILIEAGIVLLIIIVQLVVSGKNRVTIAELKNIFPESYQLALDFVSTKPQTAVEKEKDESSSAEQDPAHKVAVIRRDGEFSQIFQQIVEVINDYLVKNKGGASFPAIREITERRAKSLEDAIETVLALPLYMGLLGTFSGVIIGLIKIAMVGVTDAAIQSFVGGVLVGMLASSFGLFLTIRNNQTFKNAKKVRDQELYDFFNFVRANLIPPSHKHLPSDFKSLRYNLAAFSDEFITYQSQLNNSLVDTLKQLEDLKDVMHGIRNLESGINHIADYIKDSNHLMEKQSANLSEITHKTAALTTEITHNIESMDGKMRDMMYEQRMAIANMGSGGMTAMTETATQESVVTQQESAKFNQAVIERLEDHEAATRQIGTQLNNLYSFLQKSGEESTKKSFLNSGSFKFFTFMGSLASILAVVALGYYLIFEVFPTLF